VTTFLLVRHASHDLLGLALAGRSPAVNLNEAGRREARVIAERLSAHPAAAVYVSPQPRALQTAQPLADRLNLRLQVDGALDEIDFGRWTGARFAELADDPLWPTWVERRSIAQPPGGEAFVGVQERIVCCLDRLQTAHPDKHVVVVSHGDVLKAALAKYLHISLDDLESFDLRPASVSIVVASGAWRQVRVLNWTPELPS
jgi:broad specificity phosphatase PhoE